MANTFSTIDEYISAIDSTHRSILEELRQIIKGCVPTDAKETINYGMPTFQWNGNLIHFALNKNHLGIYPGSKAIEALSEKLTYLKTSKGAIQLPLDKPLPKSLIEEIVAYNIELLKDKTGPKWDAYRSKWEDCEEFMSQLILKTNLAKEFKWGTNIYTHQGKNVLAWAGFKDFFSLWFYNGVFLLDRDQVLISAAEGKTKALRQWRFTDVKQMDEAKILAYIYESIQTIEDGKEIIKTKSPIILEGFLKDELDKNLLLKEAFEKLTAGKKKEYIAYIQEAKQEKTKQVRMDKITTLILGGSGLHDKYKR